MSWFSNESNLIATLYVAYIALGVGFAVLYLIYKLFRVDMVRAVEETNTLVGKIFAWMILILTFAVTYEVFCRYALKQPTDWAFDVSYMLYGALFMMAGAYTLARNGHVRGDFLYRNWPATRQAQIDLALYFLFYFPGILALIYSGWQYFELSYLLNERSAASPNGPIIWPFKAVIPITGVFMLLQGIVEVARCIICIRTGEWPQRLHDVEEMEKLILEEAEAKRMAEGTR